MSEDNIYFLNFDLTSFVNNTLTATHIYTFILVSIKNNEDDYIRILGRILKTVDLPL